MGEIANVVSFASVHSIYSTSTTDYTAISQGNFQSDLEERDVLDQLFTKLDHQTNTSDEELHHFLSEFLAFKPNDAEPQLNVNKPESESPPTSSTSSANFVPASPPPVLLVSPVTIGSATGRKSSPRKGGAAPGMRYTLYRFEELSIQIYTCSECSNSYEELGAFETHLRQAHPELRQTRVCDLCGLGFAHKHHLQRHRREKHELRSDGNEARHVCPLCGKEFKRRDHLLGHERAKHSALRSLKCQVCGKGFYRKDHLKRHMGKHGAAAECRACGKTFARKANCAKHEKICTRNGTREAL